MKDFLIWGTVSMAWTEIGLLDGDYPKIARELCATYDRWDEVDSVILGDVVGSFALESAFLPLGLVPLIGMFLITPFPDWGYEEAYLKRRMLRWKRSPRWMHYLNPLRLAGYPLAFLISFPLRHRLKKAYIRERGWQE
jgi:hypothetical protein